MGVVDLETVANSIDLLKEDQSIMQDEIMCDTAIFLCVCVCVSLSLSPCVCVSLSPCCRCRSTACVPEADTKPGRILRILSGTVYIILICAFDRSCVSNPGVVSRPS
eukprot:COSAG05_NODE_6523_length_943_cov_1.747630_1_plen_107_part_00